MALAKLKKPRAAYHHGNLRAALIEAALAVASEQGIDQVTVREAGRRAGVSSGAPFRHFPNRTALLTAVAEEAMQRFRDEITRALARTKETAPLARLRALGLAYLDWAVANPMHFEVIATRRAIDFDGSEILVRLNEEIRAMMTSLLEEARGRGQLRSDAIADVPVEARAFVYGLARMWIDGHFAQWGGEREARATMRKSLDLFLAQLAKD